MESIEKFAVRIESCCVDMDAVGVFGVRQNLAGTDGLGKSGVLGDFPIDQDIRSGDVSIVEGIWCHSRPKDESVRNGFARTDPKRERVSSKACSELADDAAPHHIGRKRSEERGLNQSTALRIESVEHSYLQCCVGEDESGVEVARLHIASGDWI